ncbi:MAG: signal peptide peptidase SppA [Oscillospiraceae bacterium]|nr:signal peptide peptidase SppA [Oscillospiraceae bacterium]
MNKKRFLWFLLAAAVFAATGILGVRSALGARERAASLSEQAASSFAAMFSGETDYTLPSEPYVAKVSVDGTIAEGSSVPLSADGYSHEATLDFVDRLIEDENNVGILLYIDSPGGTITASDELYLKLLDYKATGRPIWCYCDTTACSGGYYVAAAADEICANRNCLCVNIGVYISVYNFSQLFEKYGVEQLAFKSSENKGIGMTGIPWTDEQKEIYQSIVDQYYEQFLAVVAEGRGMTPERVRELDDGREMLAAQALKAGFIDSIGRYEEYEKKVLAAAGTELLYEPAAAMPSWMDMLQQFTSSLPKSDAQSLLDFAEANSGIVVMAYAG